MPPLKTLDEPDIDVIDEDNKPPVQDSAKTIVSFLLANSFIKTLGRVS